MPADRLTHASRRPNLLIITSDQHRGDCFGFEGRAVRTPQLDRLASQGTRFASCITPNVVCQPARASMLTGLYPMTHGVSDNGIDLPQDRASQGFAATLSAAGYRTAFIGKAHFSTYHTFAPTGSPECVASSADFPDDWHGPYMGFDHVELMLIGHNYWDPEPPPRGLHYERWYHRDGQGELRNRLYRERRPPLTCAPQTFHSGLPLAWHNTTWVSERTQDYLRAAAASDQPFCLWASFPDPHHPFDAPEPWGHLHALDEVDLPRHRCRDFERRPWWHRASVETPPQLPEHLRRIREEYSRMPELDETQLREVIANYYGMISFIDQEVGRILDTLASAGLDQDTLVIFTSDHGEWLGDHGLMLKGPMMYDGLLRVGMLLRGPGVPAGRVVRDPVSTLDLMPTLLDAAQVSAARPLHGRSLLPLAAGHGSRDFAFNEWDLRAGRCGVALRLRTVRTATHRLTVDEYSGAGELYDLREDPDEMNNQFDNAGYAATRRELIDMIRARPPDEVTPALTPVGTA